jgi:homogentisate phytyltransferase / homogentisate geranylgeranyltransferase
MRPTHPPDLQPSAESPLTAPVPTTLGGWLGAFWKFSRPHTIIGTSLSVLGIYALAQGTLIGFPINLEHLTLGNLNLGNLALTWLACLAGNVYIVGLNQLTDIEIDRINKPNLPLASGEFTRAIALALIMVMGGLAIGLASVQGPWLLATVGLSLLIGTAYSLPPLRLKRFPFWAALCILGVRGAIVNLGLFLHDQNYAQSPGFHLLGQRFQRVNLAQFQTIPPELWALTLFVLVFTFAIAIFKDIPDLEGDRQYQINTFTLRLGTRAVFNLALAVLATCYLGMILMTLFWLHSVQPWLLIGSQVLALGILGWRSQRVDLSQRQAIADFYQLIWKFFFLEYFIFPAAYYLR